MLVKKTANHMLVKDVIVSIDGIDENISIKPQDFNSLRNLFVLFKFRSVMDQIWLPKYGKKLFCFNLRNASGFVHHLIYEHSKNPKIYKLGVMSKEFKETKINVNSFFSNLVEILKYSKTYRLIDDESIDVNASFEMDLINNKLTDNFFYVPVATYNDHCSLSRNDLCMWISFKENYSYVITAINKIKIVDEPECSLFLNKDKQTDSGKYLFDTQIANDLIDGKLKLTNIHGVHKSILLLSMKDRVVKETDIK